MTDEYDMSDEYDEYRPVDKEALARRFAGYAAAAASASAPSSKGPREHGQHSAYPCEACGKVATESFVCAYCPYRSRYRSNLNRHMKKLHDTKLPKMTRYGYEYYPGPGGHDLGHPPI
ncbi:hypothetical protein ONE63_006232 [Megalurothrips usitatus]|uniref:C2H2-type domain-containing protein n=1 Tax=Megalurothrips usitatus TaxID=439358 RepID=A0AAV7XZN7_9NEOP|nr:hypothetical protein ONE63_006232 [Megalurothrips usitatus]